MPTLTLERAIPWAPHPAAAPRTEQREEGAFVAAANGTRSCSGGWQFHYSGTEGGSALFIHVDVEYEDLDAPRDALECAAFWGDLKPDMAGCDGVRDWAYLIPQRTGERSIRFSARVVAPADAGRLTVRCVFRWAAKGRSTWKAPVIKPAPAPESAPRRVKVCVVTGHAEARSKLPKTIAGNVEFYSRLCERALETRPNLILLPEIALQWQVPGHAFDRAVPAPGPETDVFARIAARGKTRIGLGLLEREGDAVFNTLALIGPDGRIDGRYHKVHLAVGGESTSGVLPGDGFPVFSTEIARIGCNICMDSSAAESSRIVGLNGADLLLLPIMGDHRASRLRAGSPLFNESRWRAIMRTHAMDNQVCLAAARNGAWGSCVVDRMGEILAWNEGDRDWIEATVNLDDGYRTWNGGCFREVNWLQRRPHVYGAFVDPGNCGGL
ncbi:MAG: carbon-nitrogen hydrolase family protein [Candidatus Sumerlaeota bacterium]|nr:carbon-nitrogen hydrolase family protein [Candidatus Sumerlaeota bacterium]